MSEQATPRRPRQIVRLLFLGVVGSGLLMVAFPGSALSTLSHKILHLPGPGSGVALFGAFVVLIGLLARRWAGGALGALWSCLALGVVHSAGMPILFPAAKTVGTVGPLPLRVLAVWVLGAVLAWSACLLRGRGRWMRSLLPAAAANIAFLVFYWTVLYPAAGKPLPPVHTVIVLVPVAVAAGVLAGGLLPVLLDSESRS